MRILLSVRATHGFIEIDTYTLVNWGLDQARVYSEMLASRISSLADDADRGLPLDHVRDGMCRLTDGSHFIYYAARKDHVTVVRIVHQARDYRRPLG